MDPSSLPNEELRRELAALGIARERHRLGQLIAMLPARLDGRPYEDFDADCVAEVLVYLVTQGVLDLPSAELTASRKAPQEIASLGDCHPSPDPLELDKDGYDTQLA